MSRGPVPRLLAVAGLLALASAAAATSLAPTARSVLRQVRAIVARTEPVEGGVGTRVVLLVVEDLKGSGPRWVTIRVPGRRQGDRVVQVAGFPSPARGDRVVLSLRRLEGEDWLLSRPEDWEPHALPIRWRK